ncbi:Capsid protein [Streptococcus pseudoporcinus]|uniref:Capsid protein n=1 Tax=Streptococcus pseudoporcinus TaxID=361101 RepID=A0A4U9XP63_9STRE|nr:phage major capsid protein [Streptococcus pseudoporcinus]VTS14889.1 Capsid protein [Streptococcus pseudoporcinus]
MNRQLIFGARIRAKATKVATLEEEIKDLEQRTKYEVERLNRAETDSEMAAVDKSLEDLQKEIAAKEAEKATLEKEIADLQKQIDELNAKAPAPSDGNRSVKKYANKEARSALNNFIRTQGQERAGLKIVDGGALIPVEVLEPQKYPENKTDLVSLVNTVKVTTGSGKYPVLKHSGKTLNTVAELANNPELAKPQITEVDFSISTYRGYIPVSQELVDDADYDIMSIVADEVHDQERNTKNAAIATVLKTATAKSATGFDGIKDVLNKELSSSYTNISIIVTDSMYAALDKVKDKNGQYMLQSDVTSPTGYSFSGHPIYRAADDVLGSASGEMKAFIGDVKAFVTIFDRAQATIRWTDNDTYGQLLASALRFDAKKTDDAAGFYVTYTDAVI